MTLISLEEHEKKRRSFYDAINYRQGDRPNGIACPQCGKELVDDEPNVALMSNPPRKTICCRACNFRGYRTA